jgi:hypothetical protein
MTPKERFVSSRVTGRKVLGSANPLAKGFRDTKKGCADSVSGVFLGFILFALAFWPAWCSVRGVREVSKEVEALPLMAAEDASGQSGMIRIYGEPGDIDYIELDVECRDIDETFDVFWYHTVLREYREHPETRQRTQTHEEGGKEVEETIEETVMVQDWDVIDDEEDRAGSFMLGDISVDTRDADLRLSHYETCDDKGREEIGEEWLTVEYLPIDDIDEFVVVGDLRDDEISGGDPFIITDSAPDELVASMESAEKGSRLGLTILSIVMFFIAFNLIIGPLLFLLKYVPFIGGGLRFGIGIASLIMAIILVLILKFIIAYWWVILILLAIIIWILIAVARKKEPAEEPEPVESQPPAPAPAEEKPAAPEPPPPAADTELKCPECGDAYKPGDKFCDNCGHKLQE